MTLHYQVGEYYWTDDLGEAVGHYLGQTEDELKAGEMISLTAGFPQDVNAGRFVTDRIVKQLLEMIGEQAWEEFDECAENFAQEVGSLKTADLRCIISEWLNNNVTCDFHSVENQHDVMYVLTKEDLEEHNG